MSSVDLPQGPVRVRHLGPPGGPPVVFVHGALVDASLWDRVTPLVAAAGHHTIAPDLPLGSHRTPMHEAADLTPIGQARLVANLLEALELDGVTIVANDSGGAFTQLLLDTAHDRVARVVFTNCDALEEFPPAPFSWMFNVARLPGALRLMGAAMGITAVRHAVGYSPLACTPLDPALTAAWVEPIRTDPAIRRDFRKLLDGIAATDLIDVATRLHRFDGPVLLAWATDDRYFTLELARRLADCFADAEVHQIADSRTFVPLDQPERLAEMIVDFAASAPVRSILRSPGENESPRGVQ